MPDLQNQLSGMILRFKDRIQLRATYDADSNARPNKSMAVSQNHIDNVNVVKQRFSEHILSP